MVSDTVENCVIPLQLPGEILLRVIDNPIRTQGPNHVDIPSATDRGHVSAEPLRDLHRECAYSSRRAVDENLVSRLEVRFIAKTLQGRIGCHRYGSRLLKRCVGWLHGQLRLRGTRIFGECAVA